MRWKCVSKWVVWLLGLGLVVTLATVECLYQAALSKVPALPPRPEHVSLPPLYVRLRWASFEGSAPPKVEAVWPWTVVRVVMEMLMSERAISVEMPHGLRLAGEVERYWGVQLQDEGGRRLKVFERMALTIWLTRHWSAEEMLTFEAEHAYVGHRLSGMRAGTRTLLGEDWAQLDAAGIALLLAVADAPGGRRDPWCLPDRIRARRDWILKRMSETGVLSPEETDAALRTPPALAPRPSDWEPCPIPSQQTPE